MIWSRIWLKTRIYVVKNLVLHLYELIRNLIWDHSEIWGQSDRKSRMQIWTTIKISMMKIQRSIFFLKPIRRLFRGFHRYWPPSCFCLCALSGFHIAGFSNFACSALSGFHYSRILAFLPLVFTRSAGVSYFTRAIYVWLVLHPFFFFLVPLESSDLKFSVRPHSMICEARPIL
jgi:hypothetical protein